MTDSTLDRWRDQQDARWAEIDAHIDQALAERRVAGPNSFAGMVQWDCVDDDGVPRTVQSFDPR